ncbi:FYN-binding protein 1 isoform X2 [Scophthalmus maximus]|uniref:FYN-binding protein 1 isoform X2 n=1 Tax=Scophthalmus maximus TaxID=52904 RepID=UPI001FA82B65|nr:FYN-binding protein 1 isoform X2 [Scophthalmus maximus]
MEESVDVKSLRARFNNQTLENSSRDSGSPKSPQPRFGTAIPPGTENNMAHHRLSPVVPPPLTAAGLVRFPRPEIMASSLPIRSPSFPRPPPSSGVRASIQPSDTSKVKQKGEMLQNMMLSHQRPPGPKPALTPAPVPAEVPAPAPPSAPLLLRQQPRQRSAGEVIPLRKPLPPERPLPLKPKRPPNVDLEPFKRFNRGPALPAPRNSECYQGSAGRKMSLPAVMNLPKQPERSNKPSRLTHQIASLDINDKKETYDDIASIKKNESWSDNNSFCVDKDDDDDVYEFIDDDEVGVNQVNTMTANKKEAKKQREQEKKDQMERQKKENELRKNFQLQGEVEVLHTAKVRHDWHGGGKLELAVRQGESVEILRVKNNPLGKWLARSLNGNYGYISNTCVDIDYEAVKRKVLQLKKIETSPLPPPPPDPPQLLHLDCDNRDSMIQDEDDYDDVQPITEDFPPPPPEISLDSKAEKELRKKFKYEGPLSVLHTMMVDPNGVIKRPGGKDLHVCQGEVLDVIHLINSKKALCRNSFGKYGYVCRSLLLPMEGDIYDDVDYPSDVYDNDSPTY